MLSFLRFPPDSVTVAAEVTGNIYMCFKILRIDINGVRRSKPLPPFLGHPVCLSPQFLLTLPKMVY